ncbi:MAG: SDR family oxidoreductase [Candidatus Omnitrophica bacterium]|nr:SDR family oxidoreductase [Candidatus Omnitrophota bacterium]
MKILITGGAGFIGSHLCKKFLDRGDRVVCIDNFITGSKENVRGLIGNNNFTLIEHDISKPFVIEEDIDWVLHFAAIASPNDYLAHPIKTLKSGLLGTHNCLGLAKLKKAKFFLASTSEVYGDPLIHPQPEEYWGNVNTIGERSCYDESKRGAEALTYAYHRQHNIEIRIVRIFNTYGPNMQLDDGRVVSNFIVQVLKGKALTIYGKGTQTRSFCFVDDLIEGILKLMDIKYLLPINLGNPSEYTMLELAKKVMEITGLSSKITFFKLPQDDPKRRKPDITKATKILKWKPRIDIDEGLKRTIEYFSKKISLGKKEAV